MPEPGAGVSAADCAKGGVVPAKLVMVDRRGEGAGGGVGADHSFPEFSRLGESPGPKVVAGPLGRLLGAGDAD